MIATELLFNCFTMLTLPFILLKAFLLRFDFVIASVKLTAAIGRQPREKCTVQKSATPTKVGKLRMRKHVFNDVIGRLARSDNRGSDNRGCTVLIA